MDKTIDGSDNYQYQFVLNPEGIKLFLVEFAKIVEDEELNSIEVDEMYEEIYGKNELLAGKLLIGKKDLLPRRISFDLITKTADKTKVLWKTSQTVSFSNFNQSVQIEVPTSTKTMEEVFGEFSSMLSSSLKNDNLSNIGESVLSTDPRANIDSDGDGLSDLGEDLLGTDPNQADTDGDGFADGEELEKGYNPNGSGKLLIN